MGPRDLPAAAAPDPSRARRRRWLRKWLLIVPGLTLAGLSLLTPFIRSSLIDWNDVPSRAMIPTVLPGDRVIANKAAYGLRIPFTRRELLDRRQPRRGDLVVFFDPLGDGRLLKRVVGLPGEEIELRADHLFVDGRGATYRPLEAAGDRWVRAYLPGDGRIVEEALEGGRYPILLTAFRAPDIEPLRLENGEYFVLGDNRDNSRDSRHFGPVPRAAIIGRVRAVAFSVDRADGFRFRPERRGMTLPGPWFEAARGAPSDGDHPIRR